MAVVLSGKEFDNEVLENDGVVLVDFFAEWCNPCRMLAPILDDIAEDMEGKAKIFKIDVDEASELADRYDITTIPHLIIFKDGEVVEEIGGFHPKESLIEKLEKHCK